MPRITMSHSVRLALCFLMIAGAIALFPKMTRSKHAASDYVFSGVTARITTDPHPLREGQRLSIDFTVGWAGDTFPGWRPCHFEVFAADGSLMGEEVRNVADWSAEPSEAGLDIPLVEGAEGKDPETAQIVCEPTRLDDPRGTYQASNAQIRRDPQFDGDLRSFALTFDSAWRGVGLSGVNACQARVRGDQGSIMFVQDFNLSTVRPSEQVEYRFLAPFDVEEDPSTVSIACQPR